MTGKTERPRTERPARESRHRAREAALQMLYQWEVGKLEIADVFATFWAAPPEDIGGEDAVALSADLRTFAASLAAGVARSVADLDPMIAEAAEHWRLERMNVLDRLILRLAVYEFLHQPETPGPVIINEALELARTFSGDDSVKFINGILDGIRRTLHRE